MSPVDSRAMNISTLSISSRSLVCLVGILLALTPFLLNGCKSNDAWPLDESSFETPPDEAKPIARWWWPGGSISEPLITSELAALKAAGFGGVEIQPFTFGLTQEELEQDPAIMSVGTPAFLQLLAYALEEGKRLGLEMDVTLGSGWPGGAPSVGEDRAEELLINWYDVEGGERLEREPPALGQPDYVAQVQQIIDALKIDDTQSQLLKVSAARLDSEAGIPSSHQNDVLDITDKMTGGMLQWDVPDGRWRVFSLAQKKVGHVAVGAAYPQSEGPAWVYDHLSDKGTQSFLGGYGTDLMEATLASPPHALFVDSFEFIGQLPWTADFLDIFHNTKGYQLTAYLPFVFLSGGETKYGGMFDSQPSAIFPTQVGTRVREDYEDVRAQLFLSHCIKPLQDFSREQGTLLRLQAHGGYGHVLDAYALADIPESEGLYAGGSLDFLKLASSAAHIAGRKVVTSESFVSVNLDNAALSTQDLYLLSARAFTAGINRLVFHGFAYDYPTRDGRRWFPFAPGEDRVMAGPLRITSEFTPTHEIWPDLEAFTLYLARMGHAMTTGDPLVSVAWFMPEREIPDGISLVSGGVEGKDGESDISSFIRAQGFDYDRVSPTQLLASGVTDNQLTAGSATYSILLVEGLEAAHPDWLEKILELSDAGVSVVWIGEMPTRSRGYQEHEARDLQVAELVNQLQQNVLLTSLADLDGALEKTGVSAPVVRVEEGWQRLSTAIRSTSSGYIVALCNEYDHPLQERVRLQLAHEQAQILNPQSGEARTLHGDTFTVELAPGLCELLVTR